MAVTINGDTGVTTPGISNSEGYTGDGLTIAAGAPSGAVAVDSSGNVGILVTPSAWSGYGVPVIEAPTGGTFVSAGNGNIIGSNWYYTGSNFVYKTSNAASYAYQVNGQHRWYTAPSGTAGNAISFTQAMTLDATGNLLVGTTSNTAGAKFMVGGSSTGIYVGQATASGYNYTSNAANNGGTYYHFAWYSAGTYTGEIRASTTTTTYSTSSDYRLKNTIVPMTGALAKVQQLKPCTYKWNADGSDGEGFIAHELAEVVPQCVTGEKDAVDAEGKPVYQGIDTSFLVATLTAAIQELKAQVDAQAVEIAALKGQA